ncbi:NUMOD4 motif-containing HNH endonuclease [Streptomyces microflavus]|uniref:NUMOD4 motif-containing HNH endonuclease n=1 Tax=Streptomyces microflavus TaxID=1919 RepID=UPI0033BEDF82
MSDAEEWRQIAGYEGLYDVSNLGRVRSWSRLKRGAALRPLPNQQGYLSVALCSAGRVKYRKIHQLVLEAFVGPRPAGNVGRHLDGNLTNNVAGNLAWGTHSENMADCLKHGTHPEARKTHCPAGHEYSPENTVVRVNGKRRCRACQRERAGYKGGLPMKDRTHCPQGHEYSPENTEVKSGGRRCKTCRKAYGRARNATRRRNR